MPPIRAFAASGPKSPLTPFEYEPGPLADDAVEIKVRTCGICHSDLSMLDNDWGMTQYPFVPGHEVEGTIAAVGSRVTHLKVGQAVGLGWYSRSCMTCRMCMQGDHNLCPNVEGTIIGRHGGFADRVRCAAAWALPIPDGVERASAGPLLCGGITVFNPIVQFGVMPTHRVGVIGIGGLGHMAIRFLRAWGCDVTAFSSSADKEQEARDLGAHHFVNSRDAAAIGKLAGAYDFIISTINVPVEWGAYLSALAPRGRLHFVGAVGKPVEVPVMSLLMTQRSISASPLGSPATTAEMLDFAGRHKVEPVTEVYPFSRINDAIERLRSGKARYRVVLTHEG